MYKESGHKEKQTLIQKISGALENKNHIIFAYIFGSFNTQETFKDIDIALFIADNDSKSALKGELDIERELEDIIHRPVDVRILNKAPISFVYQVIKGGIIVVDKNKDLRADFEGLTCKKYFDFRHLRIEYLREVANAPV
jgi:predicted nucleotidyltransferase